jgi:hypothetical protein
MTTAPGTGWRVALSRTAPRRSCALATVADASQRSPAARIDRIVGSLPWAPRHDGKRRFSWSFIVERDIREYILGSAREEDSERGVGGDDSGVIGISKTTRRERAITVLGETGRCPLSKDQPRQRDCCRMCEVLKPAARQAHHSRIVPTR